MDRMAISTYIEWKAYKTAALTNTDSDLQYAQREAMPFTVGG
jgi:hypothetical protein